LYRHDPRRDADGKNQEEQPDSRDDVARSANAPEGLRCVRQKAEEEAKRLI